MENELTAEQEARDMLERMGVRDAQSFSSGDLVELANLIAEVNKLRKKVIGTMDTKPNGKGV